MKTHKKVKESFQCVECDKTFTEKHNLTRHKKMHSDRRELFNCDNCEKIYTEKATLFVHIKKNHIRCSYCEYVTKEHTEDIEEHEHSEHYYKVREKKIEQENNLKGVKRNDKSRSDPSKWVPSFKNKIDNNFAVFICCSCHKEDFEVKLLKTTSHEVVKAKEEHKEIFERVVINHQIISPRNFEKRDRFGRNAYENGGFIILDIMSPNSEPQDWSKCFDNISISDRPVTTGCYISTGYYVCHTCLEYVKKDKVLHARLKTKLGFLNFQFNQN